MTKKHIFRANVLATVLMVSTLLLSSCYSDSKLVGGSVKAVADSVWTYSVRHPDGFTMNLALMTEPSEGVVVAYAATQGCHSRKQLGRVVRHAMRHDGYVGGWLDASDSLYYFDSSRLFPEDSLAAAIRFGVQNGQIAIFVLSEGREVRLDSASVNSQSLLWKVSGKDMKSPSYLYGTIHIQDERVFAFDSTVVMAFDACEAFAMEVLLDEINAKGIRQTMMMPKGKFLKDLLSKEDFALLDSLCKAKLGASALFMNGMKPFFVGSVLQQADMPQDKENALDLFLLKRAREKSKICYGVEEYMDQIKAIDAFSLKEQTEMLVYILHDTSEMAQEYEEMLEAYLSFNLDKMTEMMQDPSLPRKFDKVLINKRNVTMAKQFEKIAKEHTLFCAVGTGHLGGEKGVIALLRKKGYAVEPVVFRWQQEKTTVN